MKRPQWLLLTMLVVLLLGGIGGYVFINTAGGEDARQSPGSNAVGDLTADGQPEAADDSTADETDPLSTSDSGDDPLRKTTQPSIAPAPDSSETPATDKPDESADETSPPTPDEDSAATEPVNPRPGRKPAKSVGGLPRKLDRFAIHSAMNANGTLGITCGPGHVQLWSPDKDTPVWQRKHGSNFSAVADISPDGAFVATTSEAGNPLLVRGTDGEPVWEFEHEKGIEVVSFTPDAARVVVVDSAGAVFLLDVESGTDSRQIGSIELAEEEEPRSIQWDATRETMYIGTSKGALYSVSADGQIKLLLTLAEERFRNIVVSPDGRSFLSGERESGLYLRSLPGAEELKHFALKDEEQSVFSPVAAGRDRALVRVRDGIGVAVHLWDVAAFKSIATVELTMVTTCAASADGRRALTGELGGGVRFWSLENDTITPLDKRRVRAVYASFLPDGRRLLIGETSGRVSIRDVETMTELEAFETGDKSIEGMLLSPTGEKLLVVDSARVPWLWTVSTREKVSLGKLAEVQHMQFSPDGRLLYLGVDDKISTFDTGDGSRQGTLFDTWQVGGCRVNPDATRLAVGGRAVLLFDLPVSEDGETLGFGLAELTPMRFSPDGRLLAVPSREGLVLWDVGVGEIQHTIEVDAYVLEYRPGHDEILAEDGKGFIHRYSLDGEKIETLGGGPNVCWHVSWSPDGSRIVGVGDDQAVYIWDID